MDKQSTLPVQHASPRDAKQLKEPLLDDSHRWRAIQDLSVQAEGGTKKGGKKSKKAFCKKEKKYKPLQRNVRMVYSQFDKQRRWLRCKKISKNIFIAIIVYFLVISLKDTIQLSL